MDIRRLGLVPYEQAWKLQRQVAEARRAGFVPDTLILLEHPHVYTIGRSGTRDHVYLTEDELVEAEGVAAVREKRPPNFG